MYDVFILYVCVMHTVWGVYMCMKSVCVSHVVNGCCVGYMRFVGYVCMSGVCVVWGEVDVCVVWPVPSVSMGYMWCLCVVCEGHVCVCICTHGHRLLY